MVIHARKALMDGLIWKIYIMPVEDMAQQGSKASAGTRITRMPVFWDTPRRHMITHISDSHQIPSHNKTKSKLQI